MINRREFLSKGKVLALLPFISLSTKGLASKNDVGDFKKGSLEEYIQDSFLSYCREKGQQINTFRHPYRIKGLFLDDLLHRQRRVGWYWFWGGEDESVGGSVDFSIKEMKEKFPGFTFVKLGEAIDNVHNKYTGENRNKKLEHESKEGLFAWEYQAYYY